MKKRKKMINTIKIVIVVLMAVAVAFSALAPVFGETLDAEERRKTVLERVRETANSIIPKKDEEVVDEEDIEEKVEARERIKTEAREGIAVAMERLQEISKDVLAVPEEVIKTVQTRGVPAGFSFGNMLREKAMGEAVRYLQRALNTDPETRVAEIGGGSPGNETTYFGPNTKQALIKFQRKHGVSATGILDSQTRSKINEVLERGVTVREAGEKDMESIRERFNEVVQMVKQLREKMGQIDVED